ncbi:MAG: transcriptional regulator [Candidatus Sumerlaeota bacterium]|nr:transcriptional regulator [Candidatus Sumerlaeota bacterium]
MKAIQTDLKTSAWILPRKMPVTYDGLIRLWPLRPIRKQQDYDKAKQVIDALAVMDRRTEDQDDYLDVLAALFEDYEEERYPFYELKLAPLEVLKEIMEDSGLSASDLGRLLGHRQLGGAILRGERALSKAHIQKLAAHFHLNPSAFLPPDDNAIAAARIPARSHERLAGHHKPIRRKPAAARKSEYAMV